MAAELAFRSWCSSASGGCITSAGKRIGSALPVGRHALPAAAHSNLDKSSGDTHWGYRHGVIAANAFFENVHRHRAEGREVGDCEEVANVVLEFRPNPTQGMLLACLWFDWKGRDGEDDLLSFALITDEPPSEVAAAGHDRCVIPIKPENLEAWLVPDPRNLRAMQAILDYRRRPYYDHRSLMAA